MKVTRIRTKKNELPSTDQLLKLEKRLNKAFQKAGFITKVTLGDSRSNMKIGLHMASFKVDVNKIGHNAMVGKYKKSPKGYVRTNTPTWEQRVEFNDIVNDCFNKSKLSARITSGKFLVRDLKQGAMDEQHWQEQSPDSYSCDSGRYGASTNGYGEVMTEVYTEVEACEMLDSDRLEAEYKVAKKLKAALEAASLAPIDSILRSG